MEPEWTLVYSTDKDFHAHMLQQMLNDHDIPVVLINKKDSAYVLLGEIEFYVPAEFAVKAIHLLHNFDRSKKDTV
jgi:peptide subunit release factor 1 (eRF1)